MHLYNKSGCLTIKLFCSFHLKMIGMNIVVDIVGMVLCTKG